jgi:hypothetical protein
VKGPSLAVAVLLVACGATEPRPEEPKAVEPGEDLEPRLRRHAARYLQCSQAKISLERIDWTGAQGSYLATGCGWQMGYLVACQADGHCGFVPADDPHIAR